MKPEEYADRGSALLGPRSDRFREVLQAARNAILTGSVMVGAIGFGKAGLDGFLWVFLIAIAVSGLVIYALLFTAILPLLLRRPDSDALTISLCSMVVLPVYMYTLLWLYYGSFPSLDVPVITVPMIASVVYGVLIGGHLRRLELRTEATA